MWAPSSTTTPGPKNTLGSMVTSRPITVSKLSHTVSGATSVAPSSMTLRRARFWKTASAAASCSRELTPSASSGAQRDRQRASSPSAAAIATASVR